MQPEHLQDDLRQEAILALAEQPESKLIELEEKGHLKFFVWRIITNMIQSGTSKFYFTYRRTFEDVEIEAPCEDYVEPLEINLDSVFDNDRNDLYEKDMLWHYVHTYNRNATQLAKDSGIPYRTVLYTLDNAKKKVKQKYKL
jgi:DNA-directed RNA polymerase specialized sigma24 family protein